MTTIPPETQPSGPDQWYPTEPGDYDEMLDGDGQIRPHWEYLIRALRSLGRVELERRGVEAAKLLRVNGVTYNVYSDPVGQSRPWQLDPVPLLVSSEEWAAIESGLLERAELLNLILADIYGPRELIRKGLLPLELIYNHGGFLRACDQITLRGKHQLVVYAADLARGPDNRMWVLGDRTQAPSGAGYALENRLAMTRVLPSLFRDSHVHRLAMFFQSLRVGLNAIAPAGIESPNVVVLTPGPLNETFFEHAYLATYLGYPLVQGDDLTVRDGYLWLKSLNGLERIDVILRRVDDNFCDPLELREDSRLGVPGLVEVVRRGNVAIANPLGSSILENPGLLAFLPGIAKHFLGHKLRLPTAATWWCGQPKELDYVLANLDKLVIKQTYRGTGVRPVFGHLLSQQELSELRARIRARPGFFVGQEREGFSTVPSFVSGEGLEPRHAVLRSFVVASADGYVVMPGGLTRSSLQKDDMLVSNQAGSLSKDTWVLASEPEKAIDLTTKPTPAQVAASLSGALPSRAADNLFWVGRYVERAEGTIRLLRATIKRLYGDPDHSADEYSQSLHCLLRSVTQLTGTQPGFLADDAQSLLSEPEAELLSVVLDEARIGSLANTLRCLVQTAYAVRDLWSSDTWRVMDELEGHLLHIKQMKQPTLWQVQDLMSQLITKFAAFGGMVTESMTRGNGWLFLDLGRRLERSVLLLSLLRSTLPKQRPEAVESLLIEALLETSDNLIYYRQRYRNNIELTSFLELLLDENSPRSLAYQTTCLQAHVSKLPRDTVGGRLTPEERLALEASSAVRLVVIDALTVVAEGGTRQELDQLIARLTYLLLGLSDAVTAAYFRHESAPQPLAPLRAT